MATPAINVKPARHTWIISAVEGGIVLSVVGMLLLTTNPFWHLDASGNLDRRVSWWNGIGQVLIAGGLVILVVGLAGLVAALTSRCFRSRPSWPYALALIAVIAVAAYVNVDGFTRDYDAHFEWDSGNGFRVFQLQRTDGTPSSLPRSFVWRSLVGFQVQPLLQGYFRVIDWQRVNGHVPVTVARVLPVAWPVDLGSEGETLEDPDQTPLMKAAAQSDLKAVQQLLSTDVDVNARDQSGQTALIIACRTPSEPEALVKALLDAHADVNAHTHNDYSALSWAMARGNNDVVRLLRRVGARP